MKKIAAVLMFTLAFVAFAQDAGELPFYFDQIGVRFKWAVVPTGADIGLGFRLGNLIADAPTNLVLTLGGAYEDRPLTRSDLDGSPLAFADLSKYDALDFQGELRLGQFIPVEGKTDLLEAWLSWRSGFWTDMGSDVASVFGERNELFMNSLAMGLTLTGAETNEHMLKKGVEAEFTAEWGPGFMNPAASGGADFARATGEAKGWLPLWDARPDSKLNFFSLQACGRILAEYCDGDDVPLIVGQFFGGRRPGQSLGDAVRGYGWGQFDAAFKAAANAELRLLGPAFFKKNLMPILFAWFDAGCYSNYHQAPAANADDWGIPMSTGAGFAIDVLGIVQPTVRLAFPLTGESAGVLEPAFGIKFFLHF